MKLFRMLWVMLAAMFLAAMPIFAQPAGAAAPTGNSGEGWRIALAGIGMGIASGLCGLGQGKAAGSAAEAIARNPGAVAAIRGAMLIGLVLIESLALYTLVIILIVK